MAILSFKKTHETANLGTALHRVYKREYQVTTDDVDTSMVAIMFDRRCPKYGARFDQENLAFANDIDIQRRRGSKFHWDVTVTFDSDVEVHEDEENPLRRKPKISLSAEFYEKEAIKDRNGLYYMNTAGDPIQGVMVDFVRWKIKFKRNIPIDFPGWIMGYANRINNDPCKIRGVTFPKNTLRITGLDIGEEDKDNDIDFCELSMEFTYDEDGWVRQLVNQGFNEILPNRKIFVNGKKYPWKQKILIKGEPPAEPCFLDKTGSRPYKYETVRGRQVVVYKEPPDPSDIVVIKRDPYYELPFSKLPLK